MKNRIAATFIVVTTALVIAIRSAAAQEPAPSSEPSRKIDPATIPVEPAAAPSRDRLEIMKEQLALTPGQIEKIKPIVDRDKTRTHQLNLDGSLSAAERQKKMGAMMKASLEEILPHLTPEQQEKWKEYKSRQRSVRENK